MAPSTPREDQVPKESKGEKLVCTDQLGRALMSRVPGMWTVRLNPAQEAAVPGRATTGEVGPMGLVEGSLEDPKRSYPGPLRSPRPNQGSPELHGAKGI